METKQGFRGLDCRLLAVGAGPEIGQVHSYEFNVLRGVVLKRPGELRLELVAGGAPVGGEVHDLDRSFGETGQRACKTYHHGTANAADGFTPAAGLSMTGT